MLVGPPVTHNGADGGWLDYSNIDASWPRGTVTRETAKRAAVTRRRPTEVAQESAVAHLRDAGGRRYLLRGTATRIGRLSDNDIVLDDDTVSRYHAVIIDTGNC